MATPTDARTFAIAPARKFLERLVSQSHRTRRSAGAGEVHDLRVAIRRFSQVLAVFSPFFSAKEVKRIHRMLKKVMAHAGEARDLDIAIDLLRKSRFAKVRDLRSKFQRRRSAAGRTLAGKLQNWDKRRMFSKWRRHLLANDGVKDDAKGKKAASGTVASVANRTLPELAERFFILGGSAANRAGVGRAEPLHQLRIAAKKLRYTLELFAPLRESAIRHRLEQLKKLQRMLGGINDLEIVRDMVLQENGSARLGAELARRRDREIEEFSAHWQAEFAGPANAAGWRKDLKGFHENSGVPRKRPAKSDAALKPSTPSYRAAS